VDLPGNDSYIFISSGAVKSRCVVEIINIAFIINVL